MERRLGEVEWSPSEQSVRAEDFQVITLITPSKATASSCQLDWLSTHQSLRSISLLNLVDSKIFLLVLHCLTVGSHIPAMRSCLKSYLTTGAATGNRTRVFRLNVQRADHYTMAEKWRLQDTHPLWRSKSGEEHLCSCNLTRIAIRVASS